VVPAKCFSSFGVDSELDGVKGSVGFGVGPPTELGDELVAEVCQRRERGVVKSRTELLQGSVNIKLGACIA
jgi:hypothetical protein